MFKKSLAMSFVIVLCTTTVFAADTWKLNRTHSHVGFKVRHFLTKVSGQFKDFSGTIVTDLENLENSSVEFRIRTESIDTENENRDKHLRSNDFFNAEEFPEIVFRSTKIARGTDDLYQVTGDLTIRDVTKRVTLPVRFLGTMAHPRGVKGGFETSLKIDRTEFGVNWNNPLDGGGFVLSNDVEVEIALQVDRVPPDAGS